MNIVILTGAGVSAESGLATFRDKGGIWEQYDLMDVATPDAFERSPKLVNDFYNARRASAMAAKPNAAHYALARLETLPEANVLLITQNVDDLHEQAGSVNLRHMHGSLKHATCHTCRHTWAAPERIQPSDACPSCGAQACRPDVVWFDEEVRFLEEAIAAVEDADLFALIGTSGRVSPASAFMDLAKVSGAETVELNLEASACSDLADEIILGRATDIVPTWVDKLFSQMKIQADD